MAEALQYRGTGRRKTSIARVRLVPGNGKITINNRDIDDYFGLETLKLIVRQPLVLTENQNKYDVLVNVEGGGLSGQAGAVRLGISRALDAYDNGSFHKVLRTGGFLTRDSRVAERKKYGRAKARRSFQFSKR